MASVVVVEEDDAFLCLAQRELTAAGHEVVGFADWVSVLDLLDTSFGVDAFVVDLRLPPGAPNGHALARMAQHRRPKLRVVYMTADPDLAHEMRGALPNVLVKSGDAVAAAAELVAAVGHALTA